MKIESICTYGIYSHVYIYSPNAEFGGTNYPRLNISAAEPRPKAWMLRVLLAVRDNALFGGIKRNAHHSAALYLSPDDAHSIRFQFIDLGCGTVKDRNVSPKPEGGKVTRCAPHPAAWKVRLRALVRQKGLPCGVTTSDDPRGGGGA